MKKIIFSTGSTTQHDGNTDNKGSTHISKYFFLKKKFFDWIDYPTDKHIDGNTDNKGRKKNKFFEKNIFFFSTKSTTQQTDKLFDGNTDNKGRKKKKFPKFF